MKHWFSSRLVIPVTYCLIVSMALGLGANLYAAKPQVIYDKELKYSADTYKIKKGDGLVRVLKRHGLSSAQAKKALSTHPMSKDFRFIKNNRYLVLDSRANKDKKIRFYCPNTQRVYTLKVNPKTIAWERERANLDVEVVFASGKIIGSIFQSITSRIPDDLIAYRFMDAFLLDYRLKRKVQRGAKFSIHVEKQFDHGKFIRFGEVLNASLEIDGKVDQRDLIRYPGGAAFVSTVDSHSDRPLYSPVNYVKISSLYQPRRFHPIKRRTIAHLGIDFVLPAGEPIVAPAKGKVVKKGKTRAAGNYVVIKHKGGLKSYFNHMTKIDPSIRTGMQISAGAPVGTIGCTGYCTLPHLHFAVKKNNRFVNPAWLTRSYPFSQRHLFESRSIH